MNENKKLNILFVSIAFPPKMDPECLQTAKYFKYLSKDERLNIDVVTSPDKTLFMPVDENLRKYAKGYRQIIKVPFFENKYLNFIQRKINPDSLNYPDSKFRFYKKYKMVLKELKNKPDFIYSRSFPLSSTLMAYYLQKELQVPWILHLSDPWTTNPIHRLGEAKEWNEKREKECFKNAYRISFTSQQTIELYKKKYPLFANKMLIFPNVFDIEDKNTTSFEFKDKIKVVYTGGLIGDRSPVYLLEVIQNLQKNNPEILKDFEIIFAGELDRKNQTFFNKKVSNVRHIGLLSYKEAIKLQQSADILLLIDAPIQDSTKALFFPSKLLDYMLMKKRIFAITNKDSTSWNFIDNKIGKCFEHTQKEEMKKEFINIWESWNSKDENFFIHNNIDMNYSAHWNTKKLSELFFRLSKDL